jgi:hypothetical protein
MAGFDPLHMPQGDDALAKLLDGVTLDPVPEIVTTGKHMHVITNQSMPAIVAYNRPPQMFVRTGSLVRIGEDENGVARIEPLSEAGLRGILSRCARYMTRTGPDKFLDSDPPLKVVKDIMALPE